MKVQTLLWWWYETQVISPLQGAACPGISCLHTALLLQEAIAENLARHKTIFVSYYDVSKAFDGVWVKGLFYQLRNLGLSGKVWRLLYLTYQNFECRVRIQDRMSGWYSMRCGIHQGGYLSLVKHVAFINSLIEELKASDLCCTISNLKVTPPGYADDLATACISKVRMDRVMEIVHMHGRKWRYQFNAVKSAVLVYGEGRVDNMRNYKYRTFKLGSSQVKEKTHYDHVGVKAFIFPNTTDRTLDKVSKGRKTLNAVSSIGIKRNGVSIQACNTIFWSMVVPMVTYGAELWILTDKDIEILDKFQHYAARKIQRFRKRTPNATCLATLGWMRLENLVYGKKLMFLRTITILPAGNLYRQVLETRFRDFCTDLESNQRNDHASPIYDILRISVIFRLFEKVRGMILGGHVYSKHAWSKIVWGRVWEIEHEDWYYSARLAQETQLLRSISDTPEYSNWWRLSDETCEYTRMSETLVRIVCRSSNLKSDHYEFNDKSIISRSCSRCESISEENIFHVVMQCDANLEMRINMLAELNDTARSIMQYVDPGNLFYVMLGRVEEGFSFEEMCTLWTISGKWIQRMYDVTIKERIGIG